MLKRIAAHGALSVLALTSFAEEDLSKLPFPLHNVVPPLFDTDDPKASFKHPEGRLPIVVPPFEEQVRRWLPESVIPEPLQAVRLAGGAVMTDNGGSVNTYEPGTWTLTSAAAVKRDGFFHPRAGKKLSESTRALIDANRAGLTSASVEQIQDIAEGASEIWLATAKGLFRASADSFVRHESYGVDGPLATNVTAVALDSKGALWTGSPAGIAVRNPDGTWRAIRGRDGLPVESITAIAIDAADRLWIGTTDGLIHYRPYEKGRQWFYREGERYLPNNHVNDIAITPDGKTIYTATEAGLGQLDSTETTLLAKAEAIETLLNKRHRRFGMVGACVLDDAVNPTSYEIGDNDNDGLWTSYHVAAMSLAYSVTGDPAMKASAKESMDAIYMLQNASGVPGLVARSVVPLEKAIAIGKDKDPQWRLTPDGKFYWKSDTSSDEIDGHYFAFFTYWEHIAKNDPAEREKCIAQVRALTDYLVANGYRLLDWDGEQTRWGFWDPEQLNNRPRHFLESGLNSLQMLSFLKTTYYITGDEKYQQHYMNLITEHHYLANVLLEKKVFPDSNNHSDNQLGYVAWYPILQIEQDPDIRLQLHKAVRRHYKTINRDRSSFFYYVTATIDPDYVDLESAAENLKGIPTDRRQWRQRNSHRADLIFDPRVDRFGKKQLMTVLPEDERAWDRWNGNPYLPDDGSSGTVEDAGADYLLPYWMGRFHGFIAEAK